MQCYSYVNTWRPVLSRNAVTHFLAHSTSAHGILNLYMHHYSIPFIHCMLSTIVPLHHCICMLYPTAHTHTHTQQDLLYSSAMSFSVCCRLHTHWPEGPWVGQGGAACVGAEAQSTDHGLHPLHWCGAAAAGSGYQEHTGVAVAEAAQVRLCCVYAVWMYV